MTETKAEIRARIDELHNVQREFYSRASSDRVEETIEERVKALNDMLEEADEDIFSSVLRSHEAVCRAKQMDPKAAYGQDPALYYMSAVAAEAGEGLNKIVRALRNGNDQEATKAGVASELPDVFIYGIVLASVLDLDLAHLVSEKVDVVIQRAEDGYYGGPLRQDPRSVSEILLALKGIGDLYETGALDEGAFLEKKTELLSRL